MTAANIPTTKTSGVSHAEGKKRALDNIVDPDDGDTSTNQNVGDITNRHTLLSG